MIDVGTVPIATSVSGSTFIVRFTSPATRNPLSVAVLGRLSAIVDDCGSDPGISAIVFTGTGDVFASGADLREIRDVTAAGATEFALRGQQLMTMIADAKKATVAAVNGFCFGGALDLALACDRRVAAPVALFSHPGAGLGIMTGWGGTQRLPRLIGRAQALELFFTGMRVTAAEALRIGLIDEVADDPVNTALNMGRQLSAQ